MKHRKTMTVILFVLAILIPSLHVGARVAKAPQQMVAKRCMNCHETYKDTNDIVAGTFSSLSNKAKSIQIDVDNRMQLVKFTPETTIKNLPEIKALKSPMPLRVHFKRVGEDLVATDIVVKPKMKVPEEQLMSTEALEVLVAQGPEKGGYTLIDSRPGIKYNSGHIPTSICIPFPKMKEQTDKLPKDKNALLIFYCDGLR